MMKRQGGKPTPHDLTRTVAQAKEQQAIQAMAGQLQAIATRLDALRAQGAAHTPEFRQIEQLLRDVQDKLLMVQARYHR